MDIKGIVRNVIPLQTPSAGEIRKRTTTDSATDREGNGQSSDGGEQPKRHMTPEELQEALKFLEELPGLKENNLTIRLSQSEGVNVVYVEDVAGKIVRRIPESELFLLKRNKESKKGHLLNKSL